MNLKIFAGAALLSLSATAFAQTITGGYSGTSGISKSVHDLPAAVAKGPTAIHHPFTPSHDPHLPDGADQSTMGALISATGGVSFNGMNVSNGGYIPSDNNIAVGPNHVVEVVNAAYAVYSKTGATLLAPKALGGLWTGLAGSTCTQESGDTVVQYDRVADRWIITQLGSLSAPYSECVAVSKTNDPTTTSYYLYSFPFGTSLNDYPKWGVWPTATNTAYLATYNLFANGSNFTGSEICAYDRAAMLSGAATVGYVCASGITGSSYLPIDLDGATRPLDGTPAYFMDIDGASLGVYKMAPNFSATPPTATLSAFSSIPVAGYSQAANSPQPGTAETLDSLSDRAMYRLAFRMFGDHEAIVLNHSVVAGGGNSGVRWYELRSPISTSGTFSLYQQGTYAPDSSYRWMGSAAMDQSGDIAVGYSVSDHVSTYPSVRYTGRVPTDTPGTMESEGVIINGSGSQTGYTRWGDYSSMRIDPTDDCTFWYVNEYYPATSSAGWYTRIGSFKFNSCAAGPDFALVASPASTTVNAGSAPTSNIGITALNGYSGTVNLTVASGCPTSAACTLNPTAAPGGGSSVLTVTTTSATPSGTYTVTVNGTDSVNTSLTHMATFAVTVTGVDFSMSASPTSATVNAGSAPTSSITISPINGYAGTVNLSVGSGCPANTTCSLNSGTAPATLTVTTTSSTAAGTYVVTVNGVDSANSNLAHSTTFTVTVNAAANFSMAASPTSATVNAGSAPTSSITISPINGYAGTVNLSVGSGCPANTTCSLNSGTAPATLTVTTTSSTAAGTYVVTVNGVDSANSNLAHSTTFTVTVNAAANFSMAASPSSFSVLQTKSGTSTITLTSTSGTNSAVTLSAACPTGATCSFSTNPVTPSGSSLLTVTPSLTTPPGTYTVTVTGTEGTLVHTVPVTVTVYADFTLTPMSLSVAHNSSGSGPVSVGKVGTYTTAVTLSISGLPSAVSATFAPNPVTSGGSSTLTVTAKQGAKKGTYSVTITGTNGNVTHTTVLTLTIN